MKEPLNLEGPWASAAGPQSIPASCFLYPASSSFLEHQFSLPSDGRSARWVISPGHPDAPSAGLQLPLAIGGSSCT